MTPNVNFAKGILYHQSSESLLASDLLLYWLRGDEGKDKEEEPMPFEGKTSLCSVHPSIAPGKGHDAKMVR